MIYDDFAIYGESLFETVLVKKGHIWRWSDHFDRLNKSCQDNGFLELDHDQIVAKLRSVIRIDHDYLVRVTVVRIGGRWSEQPAGQRVDVRARPYKIGASRVTCQLSGPLANEDPFRQLKSGSRLAYQLGLSQARKQGFDEALFYDQMGRLLETSTSNCAFLLEGRWLTPPIELGLLPGIYRKWLIELGHLLPGVVTLQDLARVEAMALFNSVRGWLPVDRLGKFKFVSDKSTLFGQHLPVQELQSIF